jgi:molecular chaperone DnaK
MVRDADTNRDEDLRKREKIEIHNRLDSLVYSTERTLNENRDKLDSASANELESALEDAKKALGDDNADTDRLKQSEERVNQASHKLAEVLYQQSTSQAGPTNGEATGPTESGPSSQGEDVVDAEFTEVRN